MSAAPATGSKAVSWPSARGGPATVAELTRRGFARLAEKIEVAKLRHKPLSLLRQDAKRVLEQLMDAEANHLSRPERDSIIENVVSGTLGFSPLEELFRDESRQEILTLAWNQVIARAGQQWLPTSARFRDADQYREFVLRLAEVGTPFGNGAEPGGAFDVQLPNGFRAVAILPPDVMGQPPLVLLARGEAPPVPASSLSKSGVIGSTSRVSPPTSPVKSGVVGMAASRVVPPTPAENIVPLQPARPQAQSTIEPLPKPLPPLPDANDPLARLRSRVAERLISRCAAVGVYDIRQIPPSELQRILTVHVAESAVVEKIKLDESEQERIALEILVGINR